VESVATFLDKRRQGEVLLGPDVTGEDFCSRQQAMHHFRKDVTVICLRTRSKCSRSGMDEMRTKRPILVLLRGRDPSNESEHRE